MRTYVIFIIFCYEFEKAVYAHLLVLMEEIVLIILFQLYGSRLGFLKVIYFGWVNMTPSSTFTLQKELIQY